MSFAEIPTVKKNRERKMKFKAIIDSMPLEIAGSAHKGERRRHTKRGAQGITGKGMLKG